MMRALVRLTVAGVCLLAMSAAARADCVDPAGPGVDWTRCYFDERNLSRMDLSGAKLKDATVFGRIGGK